MEVNDNFLFMVFYLNCHIMEIGFLFELYLEIILTAYLYVQTITNFKWPSSAFEENKCCRWIDNEEFEMGKSISVFILNMHISIELEYRKTMKRTKTGFSAAK